MMKLFRLPGGLQVWNSPASGSDTRFLYREVFERRSYERHGVALGNGAVVFDVGANIGMFGMSIMQRFRDIRLFAFEPVPVTFSCLERNLAAAARRSEQELTVLNVALGAADGEANIEFFPGAPSNSTLHSREKHRDFGKVLDDVRWSDMWRTRKARALFLAPLFPFRKQLLGPEYRKLLAQGVSVPCRVQTLSAIVREYSVSRIDLLKVDVEGAEMEVLEGIEETDWRRIRQLCMEVEPANKPHLGTLLDSLRARGFSRITVASMFGGPCKLDDAVACTVYAVRS